MHRLIQHDGTPAQDPPQTTRAGQRSSFAQLFSCDQNRILHFKGFAGGVPQNPFDKLRVPPDKFRVSHERRAERGVEGTNTERTTVKPWVGIQQDIKGCVFFLCFSGGDALAAERQEARLKSKG